MSHRNFRVTQIFLILCLYLFFLSPQQVHAIHQTAELEPNPCVGSDIVLLIDQSGSMDSNDPEEQRIAAAKEVVRQLGTNRLYLCPTAIHRVAVISFGDDSQPNDGVEVDLPFVEIKPTNLNTWKNDREQLTQQIQVRSLGATDFATAFARAKQEFGELTPLNGLPRTKSIFLLTDGGPCVTEKGCHTTGSTFEIDPYLRNLQSQINHDFPFDSKNGYFFWVIAMHDQGRDYLNLDRVNGRPLRDYWKALAQARGGDLIELTKNREDIPVTFYEILKKVTGTGTVENLPCGPNYIEPYVERVLFTIFKSRADIKVTLQYHSSDGTTISLKDGKSTGGQINLDEYSDDAPIEHYAITQPPAGRWDAISDTCQNVQIYRELISPDFTRVEPPASVFRSDIAAQPSFLKYVVHERNSGKIFPINPQFPLTLHAEITGPATKMLTLVETEPSTYRSTEPLPSDTEGIYQIKLIGETLSVNPNDARPSNVFSNTTTYQVMVQTQPFALVIDQPHLGTVPSNKPGSNTSEPLHIKVRLATNDGQTLNPQKVFKGSPTDAISLVLSGQQLNAQKIPLTLSSDGSGVFETSQEVPDGTYTLEAKIVGDYKSDIFQATATSATVTFTLKKAEFFDFSLEPANNATLPLNSVSPEGAQLLPLTITAQLFDSQKQPLNPAPIFGSTSPFTATLQIGSGAPMNVNLQADLSNIGKYIGQVMALDTAGAYSLTVQLAPRTPDSLYQPLRQSQTVTFNRTRVDPFDMQVLAPQDKDKLSLHEQGFGAAIGRLTSLPVAIQFTDPASKRPIEPQKVLKDPTNAISLTLIAPDGTLQNIFVKPEAHPDGPRLVGVSDKLPGLPGEYRLKVVINPDAMQPGFAPLTATKEVQFFREDTGWQSTPVVWQAIGGTSLIALLGLLFLLLWFLRTIPRGDLMLGSDLVYLRWNHFFGVSNNDLKDLGINKLRVRQANAPGEKAVRIWITNMDKDCLLEGHRLTSGEHESISPDGNRIMDIKYD